jgi:hypothetical protein
MDASKFLDQKGQAILEFMLFLPFMLMMYSVSLSIGSAINASINQQKITRGYFYYSAQNNSVLPNPRRTGPEPSDGWSVFGMQIMGWATRLVDGRTPEAPCYKFKLPLGESAGDVCEEQYSGNSSQYIRVKTVYGICGATYVKSGSAVIPYPRGAAVAGGISLRHCELI